MRVVFKDVLICAKFGKGRKSRIKEWRFTSRKRAKLFAKIFLRYNPLCKSYCVYGED